MFMPRGDPWVLVKLTLPLRSGSRGRYLLPQRPRALFVTSHTSWFNVRNSMLWNRLIAFIWHRDRDYALTVWRQITSFATVKGNQCAQCPIVGVNTPNFCIWLKISRQSTIRWMLKLLCRRRRQPIVKLRAIAMQLPVLRVEQYTCLLWQSR